MRSVITDYGGVAKLVFAAFPFSNTLIGFHKKSPFHLVQCLVEGAFYVFVLMDYSIFVGLSYWKCLEHDVLHCGEYRSQFINHLLSGGSFAHNRQDGIVTSQCAANAR